MRMEDRELLVAIGPSPSRVLDVFRRLRWTDSQAFQDSLSHMVMRQWVAAWEQQLNQSQREEEGEEDEGSDPLLALLARYAKEDPGLWKQDIPSLDESEDSAQLPEAANSSSGMEDTNPIVPSLPEEGGDLDSHETPVRVSVDDEQRVGENLLHQSEEGSSELLSAMGLSPGSIPFSSSDLSPEEGSPPVPSPPSPSHDELLKALLRGEAPLGVEPVIEVPAYGIPSAEPPPTDRSDGFVRLRDLNRSTPSSPAPEERPARPMTEAERRRQEARQQMLEAARREQAERQAAKQRAQAREAQKQAVQEKREEMLKQQRAVEASQRTNTFLSRAERARRIRDGLPLDTDKNR